MAIKKMMIWASPSGLYVGPFVVDVDFGDVDLQYDSLNNTYTNIMESSMIMRDWGLKYDLYTNFRWVNYDDNSLSGYELNDSGEMIIMRDAYLRSGVGPAWAPFIPEFEWDFTNTESRLYYYKFIGDHKDTKYTGAFGEYFREDWVKVDAYTNAGFEMLYELRANDGSGEVIYPKFTND